MLRMIHNVKYTNNLFIKSKLLKLEDLVTSQTLLMMFKAKNNNKLPFKLQSLLCSGSGDSKRIIIIVSISLAKVSNSCRHKNMELSP